MAEQNVQTDRAELTALFALLILWICAIIAPKEAVPAGAAAEEERLPVLIIDAGHGGMDGGASAADGEKESVYNLSIALRARDLASFLRIPTVLTREREDLDYPEGLTAISERKRWDTRKRVELINAIPNAALLSIHQNYYPYAIPSGAQVLYGGVAGSRRWAELTQEALVTVLDPENRRLAEPAGKSIYLMTHARCPAILVECGFISNPQEAKALREPGQQILLSMIFLTSYLKYTAENRI